MNVRRELDPEDPVEKVRRGRRCPCIDWRRDCKRKLGCGNRERERGWRNEHGEMQLLRRCQRSKNSGEGLRTAVLRTIAGGGVAGHLAIGAHPAHGHRATRCTGNGCTLHTGQNGQSRLNCEKCNHQERCELDAPFHQLILKIRGCFRSGLCFGSHQKRHARCGWQRL